MLKGRILPYTPTDHRYDGFKRSWNHTADLCAGVWTLENLILTSGTKMGSLIPKVGARSCHGKLGSICTNANQVVKSYTFT